ncbi:MAG: DUF799 family lipoprotein [Desulfobacterales bacterium]|nr:DUF799 family lipoprotein [Desulfobacterales bacterium]MDX2510677.1 DUF799 family lipoprotein [Desulfobacterales bacterium]
MRRFQLLMMLFLLLVFLAGCGVIPMGPAANPTNPIKRLAILPLQNDTTDVDAPDFVREKLTSAVQKRLYNVQPLEETDRILREKLGITLGGQLGMATPGQLREALQVEGLLYGTLMNFEETTTGLVNVRKVRGKFKIVETSTGSVFWENGIGVKSQDTSGGSVGALTGSIANRGSRDEEVPWVVIENQSSNNSIMEGFAAGLATKLISKTVGMHLAKETNQMIWRLVQNLPWGAGDATDAVLLAVPAMVMPKIQMPPPPAIGHMNYGDRDFKAVLVSSTFDKSQQRKFSFEMPIAKAGEKFRMEMDYTKMSGAQGMPPALSSVVMIHRGDEKRTYSLYTNKKKYMISDETDEGYYEEPDIVKTFVAKETIDGHPTEKYKITISYQGQETQQGFIWNATDLDGMTIRSEIDNATVKMTSTLTGIVMGTPPAGLFEVPAGYTETDNFLEIVMEKQ